MCSKNFNGKVFQWKKDSEGRVLSLLIEYGDIKLNLVNIYAPTVLTERKSFFDQLHSFFFPNAKIVFGGDFNCYNYSLDKFGGNVNKAGDLTNLRSNFHLVDIWRKLHPSTSQFTWFNSDFSIRSQLDKFLIDKSMVYCASECRIFPFISSDHDAVFLKFNFVDYYDYGPGLWHFNTSLLDNNVFCNRIVDLITTHVKFQTAFPTPHEFWEFLKESIKIESVKFGKQQRKDLNHSRVCHKSAY